jgi:hypothetical protein
VAKTTLLRRWGSKAALAAAAVQRLALHSVDLPESGTLRGDLNALQEKAVAVFTDGEGSFVPRLMRESDPITDGLIKDIVDVIIRAYPPPAADDRRR